MRDSKGKSRKQPKPPGANKPKGKSEVRLLLKLQKESLKAHGERLESKKAPTMLNTAN
jgi:hypothetical protein